MEPSNLKLNQVEGSKLEAAKFIFKSSTLYAAFSAAFSMIGLLPFSEGFLPERYVIGNPLEVSGISLEHLVGHIVFGLIVGVGTLKLRYFALAGILPIALDADHLIQFLELEAVPRLGHSIAFALMAVPLTMYLMGKRDMILGAVSFTAVFSHISFDILLGGTSAFPLFILFQNKMTVYQGYDWVFFLLAAIVIVGVSTLLTKRMQPSKQSLRI